jgi:DNA-binding transcriptional LysR family regulator
LWCQPYRSDHLAAVLTLDDPLNGDAVAFSDLIERDLVGLEGGSTLTRLLTAQAELQMRTMALRVQVRSFEAVCRAVQARLGIGILPMNAARSFAQAMQLKVLPLSDEWAIRSMQICMRSRPAQQTPLGLLAAHLHAIGSSDQP